MPYKPLENKVPVVSYPLTYIERARRLTQPSDTRMNGHDTPIDREKVIALLENANAENAKLLDFADQLQK